MRQPFHWKNFIIHYAYIRLVSVSIIFTASYIPRVPILHCNPKAIVEQGATAELISFIPDASESNNLFLVMQWLYEMCWHLSCDYVDAGGQRVSHREK